MGYRIAYNGYEIRKEEMITRQTKRNVKYLLMLMMGVLLLVIGVAGRRHWMRMLIPGDQVVTKAAFSEMMADIKTGEPVVDAFTDFCKVIIEYADIK